MEGGEPGMLRPRYLRWRVVGQTGLIVLGIIAAKLAILAFSLEYISISPLFTSVLAGGVFVLGLIVAGTLIDYKEPVPAPTVRRPAAPLAHLTT